MEEDIKRLKLKVEELEKWKKEKTAQQISYPLDINSKDILSRDFIRLKSRLDFTSSSGQVFPNILVNINGVEYLMAVTTPIKRFSADSATNVCSSNLHGFADDDQVLVSTTDVLPAPLSEAVPYYIISSTANTFKLSLTSGGAEIDLTTNGTGEQYIFFFA